MIPAHSTTKGVGRPPKLRLRLTQTHRFAPSSPHLRKQAALLRGQRVSKGKGTCYLFSLPLPLLQHKSQQNLA